MCHIKPFRPFFVKVTMSNLTSSPKGSTSPVGARRVRTDLKTSENVYLTNSYGPTRSRASSPLTATRIRLPSSYPAHSYKRLHSNTTQGPTTSADEVRTTATTVATTRRFIRRSDFILTAAKHTVNDSRILSTSAPHEGSSYISAHLPARATRLLNRSRIQQHCTLNNEDSDSTNKSPLSVRRNKANTASSRTSNASPSTGNSSLNSSLKRNQYGHHQHNYQQQQQQQQRLHQRDIHSSSDDLMLYDKSFRNAMIQDVLHFKKQLLRLRRILQETETLNPFENDNGQLFASCGLDSKLLDDIDLASLTTSTTDDPMHELADLRRQVVYLQGQVDDRDRTIRLQKNLIEKLEADKPKMQQIQGAGTPKECVNTATQTERTRPFSLGTDGLSRSKPEYTSYTTLFPALCNDSTTIIQHHQQNPGQHRGEANNGNQTRRHTIISTTLTNYNHQLAQQNQTPRRASIAWEKQTPSYKPVKITLIGDPLKHWSSESMCLNTKSEVDLKKNFINSNSNNSNINNNHNHNNSQQGNQAKLTSIVNGNNHHQYHHNHQHIKNLLKAQQYQKQQQQQQQQQQQKQQQQQQQQQPQQHYYKASHQQHNNLKPTVTIV